MMVQQETKESHDQVMAQSEIGSITTRESSGAIVQSQMESITTPESYDKIEQSEAESITTPVMLIILIQGMMS